MKKKTNILLLFTVLGIWGAIGYKLIKKPVIVSENTMGVEKNGELIYVRDTFALHALRNNPFTGKTISVDYKVKVSSNNKITKNIDKKPFQRQASSVVWPIIKYYGYIKSTANSELIILKIDNKIFKLRKGDSADEIKVKEIYTDSVKITYGGEVKYFKK